MKAARLLAFLFHVALCAFFLAFVVFAARVALEDVGAGLPLLALLWAVLWGVGLLAVVETAKRAALAWKPGEEKRPGR